MRKTSLRYGRNAGKSEVGSLLVIAMTLSLPASTCAWTIACAAQ